MLLLLKRRTVDYQETAYLALCLKHTADRKMLSYDFLLKTNAWKEGIDKAVPEDRPIVHLETSSLIC